MAVLRCAVVARLEIVEERQVRRLGVDDDVASLRQMHDHVRPALGGTGLLAEIAVAAQPGGLDDSTQRLLAPLAARLAGVEDHPQLLRLARERLAVLTEGAELFAQRAQLGVAAFFALAQPLLVGREVLREWRDQLGHGFLAGVQFALGALVQLAKRLAGQAHQFWLGLFQRVGAEHLERLLERGQLLGRLAPLILEPPFGCLIFGLGLGSFARANQPADHPSQRDADEQINYDLRIFHERRHSVAPAARRQTEIASPLGRGLIWPWRPLSAWPSSARFL